VELVAAIGKGGANIPVESALGHVFGYAIGFDMTRRDVQQAAAKKGHPWEIGKSFDQSAPCGPIYPVSQVEHLKRRHRDCGQRAGAPALDLNLMIWDVANIISQLSQQVALQPGDLIYTGTPEGVGPVVSGDVMVGRIAKLVS
jgi:fumarylpyruvate hydrolase